MHLRVAAVLLALSAALGSACGHNPAAPSASCAGGLTFTVLPVPASAILAATPLGNLGPPVHTVPTDHVGLYLTGTAIPLSSPAAMRITEVRTTDYLPPSTRSGLSDYAVTGSICGATLVIGHVQTLVDRIRSQTGGNCTTYSTATETIRMCRNNTDIAVAAGEAIGTVGGATAGALDWGLYQPAQRNFFVNSGRYTQMELTAVCPYDPFTPELRSLIDARLGEPGIPSSGESPKCGSISVDVAGTARGVWVLQSSPVNQDGDETNFLVLAPHPLYPQTGQAIGPGPAAVSNPSGAGFKFPLMTSGRVNRQFRDVTADSQIYCYVHDLAFATFSYFVRLDPGPVLTLQKVTHVRGATPCSDDPATWAINASALTFIR